MQETFNIIENLRKLSGNSQLDYLSEHKDNKILKEVLLYTYDTNKKYKLQEASINKALENYKRQLRLSEVVLYQDVDNSCWQKFKASLERLSNAKGVKESETESLVKEFYDIYDRKQLDYLFKGVLLKDLRINMGIKSFQKVWADFCFTYPYLGCKPYNDKNLDRMTYPAIVQTKMDGLFCNAIVHLNKKVEYVSRQGKPMTIQGSLDNILLNMNFNEDFVLNGEILVTDSNGKILERSISNGIIRRDEKTEDELNRIIYKVWDIIPYKDFLKKEWKVPYKKRLEILNLVANNSNGRIQVVDTYQANNKDEVLALFNKKYSEGEEGIVVKTTDGIWKDGKPWWQVKVKSEKDCDLKIIGFEEGKGAYAGMCGSLICISNDEKLKVGVKPRTPDIAKEIWNNKDYYLDKIVAVKYNEKIERQNTDVVSLFLPVFIEIRDDKIIADNLEDIK